MGAGLKGSAADRARLAAEDRQGDGEQILWLPVLPAGDPLKRQQRQRQQGAAVPRGHHPGPGGPADLRLQASVLITQRLLGPGIQLAPRNRDGRHHRQGVQFAECDSSVTTLTETDKLS